MRWLKNPLSLFRTQPGDPKPDGGGGAAAINTAPTGGLELTQLGRYGMVGVLVTICGLLFAWSRIEMVEISSHLGQARGQLASAEADRARLDLELSALTDPAHLSRAALDLGLASTVPLVLVPAEDAAP
jgi:hypothetical protein